MTTDRNNPRWTAYVLGELEQQERAEFEKEMESTADSDAIVSETRAAAALLREGFSSTQPIYLSAGQKRALKAAAASKVPWFRNRLHWAIGGAAAAILLLGVVTITVPNLLRTRQAADASPVVSSVETQSTVTPPATRIPVSGVDSKARMESVGGGQERPDRVSEPDESEPTSTPNIEAARSTEAEPADELPSPAPNDPVEESPRSPRQLLATIEGQISDLTGARIPEVDVTVTSDATGQIQRDSTDNDGKYKLPILRPGSYTVSARMPGFKIATRRGVQVERERNTRLDLSLEPGDILANVDHVGQKDRSTDPTATATGPDSPVGEQRRVRWDASCPSGRRRWDPS